LAQISLNHLSDCFSLISGRRAHLENQNAALRRRMHYLHFTLRCQQKPAIYGNPRMLAAQEISRSAPLQKCNACQASWGKLKNRFGVIPGTLVTESACLYVNKQLLERMRRT